MFEDDFPIPQVGYVNSLEGKSPTNPVGVGLGHKVLGGWASQDLGYVEMIGSKSPMKFGPFGRGPKPTRILRRVTITMDI